MCNSKLTGSESWSLCVFWNEKKQRGWEGGMLYIGEEECLGKRVSSRGGINSLDLIDGSDDE